MPAPSMATTKSTDLVILEVIGDPLAGDEGVVGLELLDEHLPDPALGGIG